MLKFLENIFSLLLFSFAYSQIVLDLNFNNSINNNAYSRFGLDSKITTNICLGVKPQCFDLVLHHNSFFLMVHLYKENLIEYENTNINLYEIDKSSSVKISEFYIKTYYYHNIVRFYEGTEKLSINNRNINDINFIMLFSRENYTPDYLDFDDIDGYLGLGYIPNKREEDFALIHQLYKKKIISHKIFSLKYINESKGQLTISQIPKYILKDFQHFGRCSAINDSFYHEEDNKNWECLLDSFYYKNEEKNKISINMNERVLLLNFNQKNFVSSTLFNSFGKNYFKKALQEKKCNITNIWQNILYQCDNNIVNQMPNITFVFGEFEIEFNNKDLFENVGNISIFNFYYKPFNKYFQNSFGISMLKKFEMIYDYDNKEIGFYGEKIKFIGKKVEFEKGSIKSSQNNLFLIILIISFGAIFVSFLYSKLYLSKKHSKNESGDLSKEMINIEN